MDSASDNKSKKQIGATAVKGKMAKARAGSSKTTSVKLIGESATLDSLLPIAVDDDFPASKKTKLCNHNAVSSDSSDEDQVLSSGSATSVYTVKPMSGIFKDAEALTAFIEDFVSSSNDKRPDLPPILKSVSDVRALRTKLSKVPLRRVHYTQFNYKTPIRLAVVTNMFGAFVNSADAFSERQKIYDIAHLEPKHKVSMLLPSVEYWWHDNSKLVMKEFVESKLVNDLKRVMPTEPFAETMNKFQLEMHKCWFNLRDKLLSATKDTPEGKVPGVFNVKVPNTQTTPSRIHVELMEFKNPDRNQCDPVKWKKLIIESKFIHAFAIISISGFKITRTGLSLDSEIEFMAYMNIPKELQRPEAEMKNKMQKKFAFDSKWIGGGGGGGDSSSSEDEAGVNKSYDKSDLDKYFVR